jgi:hypothetical protein
MSARVRHVTVWILSVYECAVVCWGESRARVCIREKKKLTAWPFALIAPNFFATAARRRSMALFRGGGLRLLVCFVLAPSSAAFGTLPTRRGGTPAMTLDLSTWSDLETRLPSCASIEMPTFDADTVDPAALEGATVLFADRNRWCPNSERVWLALELKQVHYVTVLVDDEYSATPGEDGCLPRVQWPDGTTNDGSGIRAILERIETEHPHEPNFFPRISVTVAVVRDSLNRFDAIMPRFTRPSTLAPYVYACKIQRAGVVEAEECEV